MGYMVTEPGGIQKELREPVISNALERRLG